MATIVAAEHPVIKGGEGLSPSRERESGCQLCNEISQLGNVILLTMN